MEQKLQEYRAKQVKVEKIKRFQDNLKNIFSFLKPNHRKTIKDATNNDSQFKIESSSTNSTQVKKRRTMNISEEEENSLITEDVLTIDEESLSNDDNIWCCTKLQLFYYFLCFLLWTIVYLIFIKLQFGTVYLILSAMIFMYLNTGTTPKKSGEMSAYSVFNKDCTSIDGTLKAEQFEREIMYGPGSIR